MHTARHFQEQQGAKQFQDRIYFFISDFNIGTIPLGLRVPLKSDEHHTMIFTAYEFLALWESNAPAPVVELISLCFSRNSNRFGWLASPCRAGVTEMPSLLFRWIDTLLLLVHKEGCRLFWDFTLLFQLFVWFIRLMSTPANANGRAGV